MLDIPEAVKALFDRDSIRKNFRAVFDVNRPDITNANIVAESLSFSESISSSDSLSFGSAEASVLQFETVGLPNMMGLWFTAFIEIDASTLPEELQTVRPDLDFPIYALPLGRFVVTENQRNHERMVHRQVVAMSEQQSSDGYSTDTLRNTCRWTCTSNKPAELYIPLRGDTALLIAGFDQELTPEYFTTLTTATVDISNVQRPSSQMGTRSLGMYQSQEGTTQLSYGTLGLSSSYSMPTDVETATGAYFADIDFDQHKKIEYDELIQWFKDLIIRSGGAYTKEGVSGGSGTVAREMTPEEIETQLRRVLPVGLVSSPASLGYAGGRTGVVWSADMEMGSRSAVFAPILDRNSPGGTFGIGYTYGVYLAGRNFITDPPIQWARSIIADPEAIARGTISLEVKRYAKPAADRNVFDDIKTEVKTTATPLDEGGYSLDFDLTELSKLSMSFLELSGNFTRYGRDGSKQAAKLEKVNPVIIQRHQYESCWWDEYDISPVGAIEYSINGTTYTHTIGPGMSVYSIAHPEIFEKVEGLTEEKANEIIDAFLAPSITDITFTPYNLDAIAMPYLEAGDYVNIIAEDGTVVESFVLERQITDHGRLIDTIKANGVTIEEAVTE